MKKSFRLNLIVSYILIILVSFSVVAFFLDKRLEERSLHDIESSLVAQGRLIADRIETSQVSGADSASLEALVRSLGPIVKCRLTVIAGDGRVLADSVKAGRDVPLMENHLARPEVRRALDGTVGVTTHYSTVLKIDMLYVALPLKDGGGRRGCLRLALPLESVRRTLAETRDVIIGGLFFAIVLAIALGSFFAARTTGPINRMIQVSRKYAEGDFGRSIIRTSPDEIGELAETLNRMAREIEDKIRQIREQNQKFAAVFTSMIEGVVIVDASGHVVSVNPTIEKMFGVSKDEVRGRLFLESVRNREIADVIHRVLATAENASGEIGLVLPVRKVLQFNAAPIFDHDTVSGCLVVIHDVTGMRRLETIRSDFVANVSHELKTPLTSIKGFVETLLDGAVDDKENSRAFLKIIADHAERLDNLVDDLLSLSHLESKEIALKKERVHLRQEAEKIMLGFASRLKAGGIRIVNELDAQVAVNADRARIEQVFTNLIDNAIKFNKENGSIRLYGEEAGGSVKVTVEDGGIGIPEKDVGRVFERFYRVDKARSRELGGTGLGLSIVRHIVELHGGSAGVESVEGLGSKFWFTLPK